MDQQFSNNCEGIYSDVKNVPAIKDLDHLIEELHKVFDCEEVNTDYVQALLEAYKSNPKDWKKYAKFDQHRYTRNLIDEGNGKFNLMALCWGEGNGSSIHDHANAHCFVKILDGSLQETLFDWPKEEGDEMSEREANVFKKNGVTYINDTIGLHRMENPSNTDGAVTMHLYCPPFSNCKTFDQRTGHVNTVKVTFWSKYGKRTPFTSVTSPSSCCSADIAAPGVINNSSCYEPENN